jgi:hypothetical protein
MKPDMVLLIERLETFQDWANEVGGVPPVYTKAAKEAVVRLVAMDAQIIKLQAMEKRHGPH